MLVYFEDIGPSNETILPTQGKKFYLGFQCIQVCLFNSLGLFTVHWRNALLSLQFKDLQIPLQRDPHGRPPIPLVELTVEGMKSSLGKLNYNVANILFPSYLHWPYQSIVSHGHSVNILRIHRLTLSLPANQWIATATILGRILKMRQVRKTRILSQQA